MNLLRHMKPGGGIIRRKSLSALLLVLLMVICTIPLSEGTNSQNAKISLNEKNVLEVNAAYVVKTKVKVRYKYRVKVKVKVRYKYRGKWRTKYRYKYVYKYGYKYVYKTVTIRDVPPGECTGPTANCQSNDPAIKSKAKDLTAPEKETIPNPNPKPTAPNPVQEPTSVEEPGTEPQLENFNENKTAYQEAWNTWNNTKTAYGNYLVGKQRYEQYLLDYADYGQQLSQYHEYITVDKPLTTYQKATKIFNWVRDNLHYDFYYNTHNGAVGTLSHMGGNCCDHANLLIALARAAGVPARYIHSDCTFKSGFITGHVWAQLYINGRWYNADAISYGNTLGTITNWNMATMTLKGIYASLPF